METEFDHENAASGDRLSFEPETVLIPAGPFLMGTSDAQIRDMVRRFGWAKEGEDEGWFDDEQPQHTVFLSAYRIGRYPITNAQYEPFVRDTGHEAPDHWYRGRIRKGLRNHPVTAVSWEDADAYATWLRGRTGREYRLPTEAQWEKAARGTDGRLWPWGDDWDRARCNSRESGSITTTPVGQFLPAGDSPYGCAGMAGGVWEWVADWYGSAYYAVSPASDPAGPASGFSRVVRGGVFYFNQGHVRCAFRFCHRPGYRHRCAGFRVAEVPVASDV